MTGVAEQAAMDRMEGRRPGRVRALVAAAMAGAAAGAMAYHFLRSESQGGAGRDGDARPARRRRERAPASRARR
jgi:hypothetical protein